MSKKNPYYLKTSTRDPAISEEQLRELFRIPPEIFVENRYTWWVWSYTTPQNSDVQTNWYFYKENGVFKLDRGYDTIAKAATPEPLFAEYLAHRLLNGK